MSEVTHDPQQEYIQSLERQIEQLQHENKNLLTCQCEQCDNSLEEEAVCRTCYAATRHDRDRLWKENAHLQGELTYQTGLATKALLAAPPAVWSRERPTEPGWYWWRKDKHDECPDMKFVRLRKYSLGLFFKAIGDIEDWKGEWSSSPLRPPVEGLK